MSIEKKIFQEIEKYSEDAKKYQKSKAEFELMSMERQLHHSMQVQSLAIVSVLKGLLEDE